MTYGPAAAFKVKKTHKSSKGKKKPGRPVLVEGEECIRTSFLLTKRQWLFIHSLVNREEGVNASDILRAAVEMFERKYDSKGGAKLKEFIISLLLLLTITACGSDNSKGLPLPMLK